MLSWRVSIWRSQFRDIARERVDGGIEAVSTSKEAAGGPSPFVSRGH